MNIIMMLENLTEEEYHMISLSLWTFLSNSAMYVIPVER